MKHGVAFRKFSRTPSHRNLMLRNLVTSLLEHEQIKTTLAKARDTARLAEKMITLGKRKTYPATVQARAFCLQDSVVKKLFGPLAQRYRQRSGGYTRIHKFGNRKGDNAPQAILELVDNPRDLRHAMTARAIGWDLLFKQVKDQDKGQALAFSDLDPVIKAVLKEPKGSLLRPLTEDNVRKVIKNGHGLMKDKIEKLADESSEWMRKLMSDTNIQNVLRQSIIRPEDQSKPRDPWPSLAGHRLLEKSPLNTEGTLRMSKAGLVRPAEPDKRYSRKSKLGISSVVL